MTELEYTIQMNKRSIEREVGKISKAINALQEEITAGKLDSHAQSLIEGFLARDLAALTSLVAKQQGLMTAQQIISNPSE